MLHITIIRYDVKAVRGAFNRMTFELNFRGGVEDDDFGTYECSIRNQEGRGSATITLRRKNLIISVLAFFFLFFDSY